jgi:hypothetical protein
MNFILHAGNFQVCLTEIARDMNEADTCRTYILPKLNTSGWEDEYIAEQLVLTPGRIVPIGDRHTRREGLSKESCEEPHPSLPKSDREVLYEYSNFQCRIWGGCHGVTGRAELEWKSSMPPKRSTPKILHLAGELRKQTTPAEQKLWAYLRLMREDGVRFRRQHAIGTYITDFCAPRKKIIIELDGSQHLEQPGDE